MTLSRQQMALGLLERFLVPIVRFCLQRSIVVGDAYEMLKRIYVRLAREEIERSAEKANASRISLLTGLYRRDVQRVLADDITPLRAEPSVLSKVVGQWESDPRYKTSRGPSRVISYEGEGSEFYELVSEISSNVNPGTVLFELERNGAVTRTPRGLKLLRPTEAVREDEQRFFEILAKDLESLHRAAEENFRIRNVAGHLHIRTEYDNIYVGDLPQIREWMLEKGREFHKEVRLYLAAFDKDINRRAQQQDSAGGRVVLTAFSLTDPSPLEQKTE